MYSSQVRAGLDVTGSVACPFFSVAGESFKISASFLLPHRRIYNPIITKIDPNMLLKKKNCSVIVISNNSFWSQEIVVEKKFQPSKMNLFMKYGDVNNSSKYLNKGTKCRSENGTLLLYTPWHYHTA